VADQALEEQATILRMWSGGMPPWEIAQLLGMDRHHVIRCVEASAEPDWLAVESPVEEKASTVDRPVERVRPAGPPTAPASARLRMRRDRRDLDRQQAVQRVLADVGFLVVSLKAYAPVPTERVLDALYELPATERLTVAQLAVLVDQCGMRLRIEAVPA
jgi:hypothetical protein